jgi:hypothetical protein
MGEVRPPVVTPPAGRDDGHAREPAARLTELTVPSVELLWADALGYDEVAGPGTSAARASAARRSSVSLRSKRPCTQAASAPGRAGTGVHGRQGGAVAEAVCGSPPAACASARTVRVRPGRVVYWRRVRPLLQPPPLPRPEPVPPTLLPLRWVRARGGRLRTSTPAPHVPERRRPVRRPAVPDAAAPTPARPWSSRCCAAARLAARDRQPHGSAEGSSHSPA